MDWTTLKIEKSVRSDAPSGCVVRTGNGNDLHAIFIPRKFAEQAAEFLTENDACNSWIQVAKEADLPIEKDYTVTLNVQLGCAVTVCVTGLEEDVEDLAVERFREFPDEYLGDVDIRDTHIEDVVVDDYWED